MIKINLATRKQSALEPKGGGRLEIDASQITGILKEPEVRKVLLAIAVAFLGSYLVDGFQEEELKRVDGQIAKVVAEKAKLETEVAKNRQLEELRKLLDADEQVIKTKLDVMSKLVTDRGLAPKLLIALSNLMPKDAWLTEFRVSNSEVTIRGSALGFGPISDLIKGLTDSAYFTDVALKGSQQARDANGADMADFELSARQR